MTTPSGLLLYDFSKITQKEKCPTLMGTFGTRRCLTFASITVSIETLQKMGQFSNQSTIPMEIYNKWDFFVKTRLILAYITLHVLQKLSLISLALAYKLYDSNYRTFYESCWLTVNYKQPTVFRCTWHVRCWCYSLYFVATTLTDANCTPDWVRHNNRLGSESRQHPTASTLAGCLKACEFDPRCVAIDWSTNGNLCYVITEPRYQHYNSPHLANYELVSRCNTTSGQWLNSHIPFFFGNLFSAHANY